MSRTSQPAAAQLVADRVGAVEVAGPAGFLALGGEPQRRLVDRLVALQETLEADHLEHLGEAPADARRQRPSASAVALADQLEQRRQRPRRVEVVAQRGEELLPQRRPPSVSPPPWLRPSAEPGGRNSRSARTAWPRLLHALVGVRQRLPVVAPEEVHDQRVAPVPVERVGERA